jgi:protein-tyrosine-phosphatase
MEKSVRILFVCLANLCRSPLAKVIAKTFYDGLIEADSAGVAPGTGPVFPDMAAVVLENYGVDLSDHRPRHVLDYPVAEYDYIIALDSSVFMRLSDMPQIPHDRLIGWEIPDPAGMGMAAYERAAILIEENLEKFLDEAEPGV